MLKLFLPATLLAAGLALAACSNDAQPPAAAVAEPAAQVAKPAPKPAIQLAERADLICMVNDQLMGVPQIPVEVGTEIYYGCCPGCEERLRKDPAIRTAKDPVTGAAVDKAKAVIGVRPNGQVLYFESRDSFERFAG